MSTGLIVSKQEHRNSKYEKEIEELRDQLKELTETRDHIRQRIRAFNIAYNKALGARMLEYKELVAKFAKKKAAEDPNGASSEEDVNWKEFYDKAKEEYEEEKEYFETGGKEEKKEKRPLTGKDKKRLKKIYRKASALCHPDLVEDEEQKEYYHNIFISLNEAYTENDLERVEGIYEQLKLNRVEDVLNIEMRRMIERLRNQIGSLETEIRHLKMSDNYAQAMRSNWTQYFKNTYENLATAIRNIKQHL